MPNFPKNPSPAMYKPSGFKMKNSALYKSAKHGSPMQQNYDNTNPNKKDFVSTHVKKGIKGSYTVPKKTTLENLTKKQTGPLEGGKSKTPTTNSRKMQGLKNAATEVITETTQEINTLDNKKGKTEKKGKTQQDPKRDSSPSPKSESTTNRIKNMGSKAYEQLVPKAVQSLNRKILNLVKN